jgi:hypothetical protein
MVNHGRSNGCATCKQRRVKCDEGRPECQECQRLGRECGGYSKAPVRVRFKDQTSRYTKTQQPKTALVTTQRSHLTSGADDSLGSMISYQPLLPRQQDVAVSFYLNHAIKWGRSMKSTRGFLEYITPALRSEPHSSPLYAAVEAVATLIWRRFTISHESVHEKVFDKAVTRLNIAVKDPGQVHRDSTALSALMLQLYDTLAAIFGYRSPSSVHRRGAIALLEARIPLTGSRCPDALLMNVLRYKVSAWIRQATPPPAEELEQLQTQLVPLIPRTPSSVLDIIGLAIVNIRSEINDSLMNVGDTQLLLKAASSVSNLERQLQQWLNIIPDHWTPRRVGQDLLPVTVPLFQGICVIYPTAQIASLWNVWRIYRLTLGQLKMQLHDSLDFAQNARLSMGMEDDASLSFRTQYIEHSRELVRQICYSVSYYLGDRTQPVSIADVQDMRLKFPSYHALPRDDPQVQEYFTSDDYLPEADHSRHLAVQGAFHCASILSHLIEISKGLYSCRDEYHWVQTQYIRALRLLRVDTPPDFTPLPQEWEESFASATIAPIQPWPLHQTVKQRLRTVHVL